MDDKAYMEICVKLAEEAFQAGEVPIGAIVVSEDGQIIGKGHNQTISLTKPYAHAEIVALSSATERIGNYRLIGCTLYVTKEPCIMCAGAIVESRIKRLVFGCFDKKRGAFGSMIDVNSLPLNHKVEVQGGLLRERCEEILKLFFKLRRGTEVAITGPTRNRLYA